MAEALVKMADYGKLDDELEKEGRRIDSERVDGTHRIEKIFETGRSGIEKNYEKFIKDIKARLETEENITVNPLGYLRKWIRSYPEYLTTRVSSLPYEILTEEMRKRTEYNENKYVTIGIRTFLNYMKERAEKRKQERLESLQEKHDSELKEITDKYNSRYERWKEESKKLDGIYRGASEFASKNGLGFEPDLDGVKLTKMLEDDFPFQLYLERLVNSGFYINGWFKEGKTHRANAVIDSVKLKLEYESSAEELVPEPYMLNVPQPYVTLYLPQNSNEKFEVVEALTRAVEAFLDIIRSEEEARKLQEGKS